MENIRQNDKSELVGELQMFLVKWGYNIPITSFFGNQTHSAVCDFQKQNGFNVDGVIDQTTWMALKNIDKLILCEEDYIRAADLLNVEVEVIKAVKSVETGVGRGFYPTGKPVVLFERHVFYRQLKNRNLNPSDYMHGNEDILSLVSGGYSKGVNEWQRLLRAIKIDEIAAISSASWGLFQIMGFNHKICGCQSLTEFTEKMGWNEGMQLELFVGFIKGCGYDTLLRKHDWAGFAKKYNGANYAINSYDQKLQNRYDYYKLLKK